MDEIVYSMSKTKIWNRDWKETTRPRVCWSLIDLRFLKCNLPPMPFSSKHAGALKLPRRHRDRCLEIYTRSLCSKNIQSMVWKRLYDRKASVPRDGWNATDTYTLARRSSVAHTQEPSLTLFKHTLALFARACSTSSEEGIVCVAGNRKQCRRSKECALSRVGLRKIKRERENVLSQRNQNLESPVKIAFENSENNEWTAANYLICE